MPSTHATPADLKTDDVQALQQQLRGRAILPTDPDYDEARRIYNAYIDRHPALVVRAANVADVIATVRFAAERGLLLAIRGGSHGVAGYSTCDGGVVLDLGGMRGIRVDPDNRAVRAEGGCTWGDFNHATHAFGLATTGGVVSTTGIAGLTLGGGMGHLQRRFGLSCDNLLSADVVLADGSFVTCDAKCHADLFWALRGGGGNFGVVTALEYRLHPVDTILGGPTIYPLDGEAMRNYERMIDEAPDELNAILGLILAPPLPFVPDSWHGKPVTVVLTCWSGDPKQDDSIRERLRSLGTVVGQFVDRMPYPVINTLFDELMRRGLNHYWKGYFLADIAEESIDVHLKYAARTPAAETATLFFPMNGATKRVGGDDTAFAYRHAKFSLGTGPSWPDPADAERNIAWGREYYDALRPYAMGGGYVNFQSDDGVVEDNYGPHMARLQRIKAHYDPDNLFRMNQNIAPKA